MSDISGVAPGGGEGAPASIAVVTPAADTPNTLSVSQAARALAAARHKPKEPEQAAPEKVETPTEPAKADDAQPEADPVETTPEAEPEETPPIEPPRSWTKEAKDRWQSLPRETQEYLATREQERDREVRRSQNEAAEKLKGLTAKEQAVEQARQQYEAALPALAQQLHAAQAGDFADIRTQDDVMRIARDDPGRFAQWQAHRMLVDAVNGEIEAAKTRQANDFKTKWSEYASKQDQLLNDRAPELADKAKAEKLTKAAQEYLTGEIGFKPEELGQAWNGEASLSLRDHRVQLLILDGLKYREAKAAKPIAKPVPPVQRPGVAKPAGGNSEVIQALSSKLERTGSLKAAQELRAAQLKTRRA